MLPLGPADALYLGAQREVNKKDKGKKRNLIFVIVGLQENERHKGQHKDDEPTAVILYFILCSFLGPAIYGPKKRKNKRRMKIVTAVDRFFLMSNIPEGNSGSSRKRTIQRP